MATTRWRARAASTTCSGRTAPTRSTAAAATTSATTSPASRRPAASCELEAGFPAVVLAAEAARQLLEEVVGLADELRRADGVRLGDHRPLVRELRQRLPDVGREPLRGGLVCHRMRRRLGGRVAVVHDVPALGEVGPAVLQLPEHGQVLVAQ